MRTSDALLKTFVEDEWFRTAEESISIISTEASGSEEERDYEEEAEEEER